MWNSLPSENMDFSGLDKFNNCFQYVLVEIFPSEFWMNIALWYWNIYCTFFLCHYVHNSIAFTIAMFKLFYNTIAACQRPVGPLLSNKCIYHTTGAEVFHVKYNKTMPNMYILAMQYMCVIKICVIVYSHLLMTFIRCNLCFCQESMLFLFLFLPVSLQWLD